MTTTEKDKQTMSKLERRSKKFQIAANIAVFIGIGFSVYQYTKTTNFNKNNEKRKNAIAAIDKIYNDDFLVKYDEIVNDRLEDDQQIGKAFDLVFNTYYIVSVMYNDGIADKSIITKTIEKGIILFTSKTIYKDKEKESTKYNKFAFEEIDKMKKDFPKEE